MNKRSNKKLLFDGMIFDVYHYDEEVFGNKYPRQVVENNGGAAILVIHNHQVLLVQQYRVSVDDITLEIPAGKIDQGEEPTTSAKRELEEECGLSCSKLTKLYSIYTTPGFCQESVHIFIAENIYELKDKVAMDIDEDLKLVWIDINDIENMLNTGKIKDSKTIIALQYVLLHEKEQ